MRSRASCILSRQPYFPWLLALYPILHLYAANLGLVKEEEVFAASIAMLAATSIAFFITRASVANQYQAALIVSLLGLFFSMSGHIHELALQREPLLVWTVGVLLLAALAITELPDLMTPDLVFRATPWLNLIAFLLVLVQIPAIASYHFRDASAFASVLQNDGAPNDRTAGQKLPDSESRPDIYYIIPDGYSSDRWHMEAMDYDNSAFTRALHERGFIVNTHAQNNYASTLLSLASTLNMQYIDSNPSQFDDKEYLRRLIADNATATRLQRLGYTYVQFLSGFLTPSATADIVRDFTPDGAVDIVRLTNDSFALAAETGYGREPISDMSFFFKRSFFSLFLDTTLLKGIDNSLQSALIRDSTAPFEFNDPNRFLDTLDELNSIIAMPEATFTFVHVLKPHYPTTFDEQGNIISPINRPKPHQFFAELRFLNAKFLEVFDRILHDSKNEPIIIFQADHSSTYGISTGGSRRIHFDAFSAYYVPDAFELTVPRPFTFVNTFPLMLHSVFGEDLAFNENRLIEAINKTQFEQVDATQSYARWYD